MGKPFLSILGFMGLIFGMRRENHSANSLETSEIHEKTQMNDAIHSRSEIGLGEGVVGRDGALLLRVRRAGQTSVDALNVMNSFASFFTTKIAASLLQR